MAKKSFQTHLMKTWKLDGCLVIAMFFILTPIDNLALYNCCLLCLGYATYLNIQFSLYNRLKFLQLNPQFSYSTFGVSINPDREAERDRKSHKDN